MGRRPCAAGPRVRLTTRGRQPRGFQASLLLAVLNPGGHSAPIPHRVGAASPAGRLPYRPSGTQELGADQWKIDSAPAQDEGWRGLTPFAQTGLRPARGRAETILTDTAILKLRPAERRYEVRDAARLGFGIRVELDGRKVFFQRFGSRGERRLTLGTYSRAFGLAKARAAVMGEHGARTGGRPARAPARAAPGGRWRG